MGLAMDYLHAVLFTSVCGVSVIGLPTACVPMAVLELSCPYFVRKAGLAYGSHLIIIAAIPERSSFLHHEDLCQ